MGSVPPPLPPLSFAPHPNDLTRFQQPLLAGEVTGLCYRHVMDAHYCWLCLSVGCFGGRFCLSSGTLPDDPHLELSLEWLSKTHMGPVFLKQVCFLLTSFRCLWTYSQRAVWPWGDLARNGGLRLSLCVCFNLFLCQVAVFIQTVLHQGWRICCAS